MSRVSKRLQHVAGSATLEINEKISALRAEGVRVYDLGIGEADWPTPPDASAALVRAAETGTSRYTEVQGIRPVREAVCDAANRDVAAQAAEWKRSAGPPYTPDDVVVSVGSKHLQYSAVLAMCDPGDEVIVQAPYWVSYPEMIRLAGVRPVVVQAGAKDGFVPPVDRVARAITDKTRIVFLNSPNNPTGQVWAREHIAELCELILRHDNCCLLSDEIYGPLVYGETAHVSPAFYSPLLRDRLILTSGLSKAYSMGGWRIGWALVKNPEVRAAISRVGANTISSAPSVIQDACVAALGAGDRVEEMRRDFEKRAELMNRRLNAMGLPVVPSRGAFYVFPDVSSLFGATVGGRELKNTHDVVWALLEDAAVASVAGDYFGSSRHVRLSYVRPVDELDAACDAMEAFVLRHRTAAGLSVTS